MRIKLRNGSFKGSFRHLMLVGLLLSSSSTLAPYAQGQQSIPRNIEAQEAPKSILFPSGVPGPYFPSDDEIASSAEETLNQPLSERAVEENDQLNVFVPEENQPVEDEFAYGTLAPGQGGLAANIWTPSTIEKIEKLFSALNLPSKSPAMNEIARKLILTMASTPTGQPIFISREENEVSPEMGTAEAININQSQVIDEAVLKKFTSLRTSELVEQGNLTDLVVFIQRLPEGALETNQQNAEIMMLGGDLVGACEMTQQMRSTTAQRQSRTVLSTTSTQNGIADDNAQNLFWLKMLSFCRVLEEDNSGAQVALDMLTEEGAPDFLFFDLINRLMEGGDTRTTFMSNGISALDPLNYTILSLLDQPIEADLIENSSPLIISALVINPNMSLENRFQAAVKSYLSGGISADILKTIYDLQEFSELEYNNAVRMAEFDDRPLADVLLYQAAAKQQNDVTKAEVLNVIWERAIANDDLPREAALNIETLRSLTPSAALINHAHHITRGLLLGGDIERALSWYNFARRFAVNGDAEATRALINIWPLAILASGDGEIPWSKDILDLWWNGQMVLSPENRDGRAALFYALAEAFQNEVSQDKWDELITENRMSDNDAIPLGVWRDMIKAVGENKPAEAITLSLIAMGKGGPGSLDASGISAVVRLLRSFGLEQEARRVAVEALVANDF